MIKNVIKTCSKPGTFEHLLTYRYKNVDLCAGYQHIFNTNSKKKQCISNILQRFKHINTPYCYYYFLKI